MHAVISANGELKDHPYLRDLWRAADLRIAVDGGAVNAHAYLALPPHVLIGDLDSLDQATRAWCESAHAEMIQHPVAKDETDLELALDLAHTRGATDVTVLGALGGRLDQQFSNVLLLTKLAKAHVAARIADAESDTWVAWERVTITGRVGETVSLIPLTGHVDGIVTQGLKYPLRDEKLLRGSSRGVSNELAAERAQVSFTRGLLLVVHLLRG